MSKTTGHALEHAGAHAHHHGRASRRHLIARVVAGGFVLVVAWLLFNRARSIDWGEVRDTLLGYPLTTLAAALAIGAVSHFVYASYDLIGRWYAHHALPTRKVLGVGLVSYAFNLNLGTLVGGVGFRWRLYSKLGLRRAQVGRVIALSVLTNWSGYLPLFGVLLSLRLLDLPDGWVLGDGALQVLGFSMIGLGVAYVAWCANGRRRTFAVRGHALKLPSARMAAAQIGVSALNWSLMGAIVWLLLPAGPSYGRVLATLLAAAVAGLVVRVPAGLGVIEAVFLTVFEGQIPDGQLIAALLAYRALYYLLPLAMAAALHFGLEATARRRGKSVQ